MDEKPTHLAKSSQQHNNKAHSLWPYTILSIQFKDLYKNHNLNQTANHKSNTKTFMLSQTAKLNHSCFPKQKTNEKENKIEKWKRGYKHLSGIQHEDKHLSNIQQDQYEDKHQSNMKTNMKYLSNPRVKRFWFLRENIEFIPWESKNLASNAPFWFLLFFNNTHTIRRSFTIKKNFKSESGISSVRLSGFGFLNLVIAPHRQRNGLRPPNTGLDSVDRCWCWVDASWLGQLQ